MRSSHSYTYFPFVLAFVILSTFMFSVCAKSPIVPEPSPSAKSDLICHTDNPAECYPKVFSATEEFQVVHDDQDLPSGLHVRMDIWSGKKEAKLSTPGSDDPALEGLPVEQSVLVVDPDASEGAPQIPRGAPAYDPVGVVKEPQVQDPDFRVALDFLKEHAEKASYETKHPLDDALVDLEDISHDMYYGKEIIEDVDAVKGLFCLLTQRDAGQAVARDPADHRDFLASSILSSSLQNNPPALKLLEAQWGSLMDSQCAFHAEPLKNVLFSSLKPPMQTDADDMPLEALWTRRVLPVVGKLLKSDIIRHEFMNADVMKHFLQILLTRGDAWEAPRSRVSRIVSDTFLDDSVGAKTGLWPLGSTSDSTTCNTENSRLEDGCWEFHLNQIIRQTGAHWAQELLDMMRTAKSETGRTKDEL
jgi:nucleotide exchange factor SIL1